MILANEKLKNYTYDGDVCLRIKKKIMQALIPHILLTDILAGLHCGVSIINLSSLPLCTSCEGLRRLTFKVQEKMCCIVVYVPG